MKLKDKTAIVTGAASGIGAATARLLASEGARVMLTDVNAEGLKKTAEEIEAAGGRCIMALCDVSAPEQVSACVERTVAEWGRVDILANVAGILDWRKPTANTENELWNRVIAINLTGTFYFCREALRQMEKQGSGCIVNVSSGAYMRANSGAAYTASKYAVVGLSKNIAIQYAGKGIRCNVVCPGVTDTPMNAVENKPKFDKSASEAFDRHMDWSLPMVDTASQANVILFYCSDECRSVTGQVLGVDNGCFL